MFGDLRASSVVDHSKRGCICAHLRPRSPVDSGLSSLCKRHTQRERERERERERKSSEEEEATPSINCAHAKKLAPFSCCWPIFDVFALIHHRNCVSGFS